MASNRSRRGLRNQHPPPQEEEEEETNSVSVEYESDTHTDSDSEESGTEDGESTEDDGDEEEAREGGEEGGDNGNKSDKNEKEKVEEAGEGEEVGLGENLLPNCPVCMEMWSSEGPHRVCCIPCGHVYGRLCLEKWLRKCGNKVGKCPQCNRKFKPTDIINLYAPQIVVPNDDLRKEVQSLWEKNNSLTLEITHLLEEIRRQKEKLQDEARLKRQKMAFEYPSGRERQKSILDYSHQRQNLSSRVFSESTATSSGRFILQNEMPLNGARVMCIDPSSEILIVCSKASGVFAQYELNKISLLAPQETDKIQLPNSMKAVKDICVFRDGLIALASLGRKLALFSTSSNNIVLQYDLPAPGWSCSGDDRSPHHIYAGLQNGELLVFDVRQTAQPLQSLDGLSTHPVHTILSLNNARARKVLTASSVGPCVWDIDQPAERPTLVPGLESHGICISLACAGDDIVASFRPKVELGQADTSVSQTISPSPTLSNSGKLGSHVFIKRNNESTSFCKDQVCHGNVSEFRMSRSAIIHLNCNSPFFAYGDESLRGVRIWGLPSFIRYADLNPHRDPILDLRYTRGSTGPGFLGCLSEEMVQIFCYS